MRNIDKISRSHRNFDDGFEGKKGSKRNKTKRGTSMKRAWTEA